MASPRRGSVAPVPFDRVLAEAEAAERARLHRYRTRWIVRQSLTLVIAVVVLVATRRAMVDADGGLGGLSGITVFVAGGWFVLAGMVGLVGMALLAIPVAAVRIAAVLRTDDLAAYERTHQPWWADRPR